MKRTIPRISRRLIRAGITLLVSAVALAVATPLCAQGIGRSTLLASLGFQSETGLLTGAGIPGFPGPGECGMFDHATAGAQAVILGCELPNLLADRFGLAPALALRWGTAAYSFQPSDLSLFNPELHTYDSVGHEYHLDLQYGALTFALAGRYRPNDIWSISFGPELVLRFAGQPRQSLVVTDDTLRLPGGARRQELYARNDLMVQPLGGNLMLGVGATVPLGNGLFCSVELRGRAEFVSPLREAKQFGISAAGGVSLSYDLLPSHADDVPLPVVTERHGPDTLSQQTNVPQTLAAPGASIQAFAIDAEREPQHSATLSVFETVQTLHMEPATAIDFPRGSSLLPASYRRLNRGTTFTLDSVAGMSADELKRQQINIIGARMVADTTLRIELAGSAGRSESAGLAAARVRMVQEYLVAVWNIDSSRIRLRIPVGSETQLLQERGDRGGVEITGDERMRAPLVIQHTERSVEPPTIVLDPAYQAAAGVRSWHVEFRYGTRVLGEYGTTRPGAPSRLDWNLTDESLHEEHQPLVVEFVLEDSLGNVAVARDSVPIVVSRSVRHVIRRVGEGAAPTTLYTLFDGSLEVNSGADRQKGIIQEIARSAGEGTRLAVLYCADSSAGCSSEGAAANRERAEAVAMNLRTELAGEGKRDVTVDVRNIPAPREYLDLSTGEDLTPYVIAILVTQGDRP